MTQEEKQLLLKDLCARLLYGVKVERNGDVCEVLGIISDNITLTANVPTNQQTKVVNIKPYLRPMSSMTEEEEKEYAKIVVESQDCSYKNNESATALVNNWYLSKGFDVRGLIPKGLALEASKDMYKKTI